MAKGFNCGAVVMASALMATVPISPQSVPVPSPDSQALVASYPPSQRTIVREIDDPHTGDHWILMRDLAHPGGPGRLLLVKSARKPGRQEEGPVQVKVEEFRPVIHAGDRLIVEEDTPVVEARLEAVALGAAQVGGPLDVRLKIGGKVVRTIALGRGRASLQPEVQP